MTETYFQNIGVIGAGAMGTGIAQIAATSGHYVWLHDQSTTALDNAKQKLEFFTQKLVDKGKMSPEARNNALYRITYCPEMDQRFIACELIIEAVKEDHKVKAQLFEKLESVLQDECIIATNTSSLSVTALASTTKRPDKFLGLHFFNPAPLMPLVEIIPAIHTREDIASELRDLMKEWKKLPVVAKDTPGFIVNRIARPFYGESLRIYEEQIAEPSTIDWALKELGGFRMGPFELMDFIGLDVNFAVSKTVYQQMFNDPRYKPSILQQRMVEGGRLGRKSGHGFYLYGEDHPKPEPLRDEILGKEILLRVVSMLINEAADALFWQIASKEDIDTAMTKGVNYPKGLLRWADEMGIETIVEQIDKCYDMYREDRYRTSPLLRKMLKKGATFY